MKMEINKQMMVMMVMIMAVIMVMMMSHVRKMGIIE